MFILFSTLISIALALVEAALGIGFVGVIYSLAILLPSLGLAVRRLHDTGKSGWWILISLLPFIGLIILIVFLATDSHADNAYGQNPKVSEL
jgi:uncharacterized membrane protein YhaH (DUF805 family)